MSSEAFRAAGVSYRRLDYWTRLGLLRAVQATPGSGTPRRWPEQELSIARAMVRLCDKLGLRLDQAGPLARAAVEDPTLHWQPIPRCPGLEIRIGPEVWAE